jgi:hypothetical protein
MTILSWDELTSGLQSSYRARAEFLIERGYKHDMTVEQLAEEIYNKDKDKLKDRMSKFVAGMIQ